MIYPEVKSLYKYKKINQFTLDIIANERIFYPLPDSFNDPFDTKCHFKDKSIIASTTDLQKIAKAFPEDDQEIIAFTRKDLTQKIDSFKRRINKFGILSLAENPKDILMWSHYADDHKGLCIEFERNESNELGDENKTRKVSYTKNYPLLGANIFLEDKDIEKSLMRVLYTKSNFWSYEKEWRVFLPEGNIIRSIPGRIKSITFGVKTPAMDIDIIKQLTIRKNVLLYQASLKENEFGIKIKKIKI